MSNKILPGSPCVNVCTVDKNTGFCEGCCRTVEEIIHWDSKSEAVKCEMLLRLEARQQAKFDE